jgi:23S rRNA G2445 N2-methylase RlmL
MCSIYEPAYEDNICDPCGGSGGFIIMAADMMEAIKPGRFFYYDLDSEKIVKVAAQAFNTYRHHKTNETLTHDVQRSHDSLDATWDRKMNRIYTNVPFGHKVPATAVGRNGQNILKNYDVGRNKRSEL